MGTAERSKDGTLRRQLSYNPLPSQHRFHETRADYKGFSGPVGSGKSRAIAYESIRLGYVNAGLLGLVGAPTFGMLRDATMPLLLGALEENELPYSLNKSNYELRLLEPDSLILLRSMQDPERLRGSNLAWFGIDELTYCPEGAWTQLQARRRHPDAKELTGFGIWTPRGFDWVYDRFIGPDAKPSHTAILASPGENAGVGIPTNYYANLKENYTDKFYRQEVLGEYLDMFTGRVYFAFDQTLNVRDLAYVPRQPLFLACDFNVTPMCWVIGQRVKTETGVEMLHVLREVVLRDASIDEAAQFAIDRIRELVPDWEGNVELDVYGDASGSNRVRSASAGAAKSDWEAVKRNFRIERGISAHYHVPPANPAVKDRVESLNRMCCNATAEGVSRRLYVDRSCKGLVKDLNQVKWKADSHGNMGAVVDKSNPDLSHLSDALGYLTHKLYGVGKNRPHGLERSAW